MQLWSAENLCSQYLNYLLVAQVFDLQFLCLVLFLYFESQILVVTLHKEHRISPNCLAIDLGTLERHLFIILLALGAVCFSFMQLS